MTEKKSFLHSAFYHPLTRIIIGITVLIATLSLTRSFMRMFRFDALPAEVSSLLTAVAVAITTLLAYKYLFLYYEKREITELKASSAVKLLTWGIIVGLMLQSLTILVIYLAGSYKVTGFNGASLLLIPLAMAISSSVFEELLIRGVLYRIMEKSLGSYVALAVSALIFGLLHAPNPNSSLWIGLSLSVQAGLLLGAAYMVTGSLWLPIGIHFAWNFAQSGIFGAATSGIQFNNSLMTGVIEGNTWITGGYFGPEGSVQATLFCLAAAIIFIYLGKRYDMIIPWPGKRIRSGKIVNTQTL
jgi:uncharacterized protein